MTFTSLLFEIQDHVAYIILNRPDAANSVNGELAKNLLQAVNLSAHDNNVRAVVLKGKGKIFCGGGDVKFFASNVENLPLHILEATTFLHSAISRLTRLDKPVIAAVHGNTAGAGLSLALASDLVLAGESSKLVMAYTKIGLSPDGSSTYFLPRVVGIHRALELAMTNRILSAREALDWGLVNRVVPDESLEKETDALARQLADGPTRAFGAAKRLFRSALNDSLETQMEQESQTIAAMARTQDAKEGIKAFAEKRPPRWSGH